jgi:hypothetical protein
MTKRAMTHGILPLLLLFTLLFFATWAKAETMVLDWSNKISREIGASDGYTEAEWNELVTRADVDVWCLSGRALFTEQGHANAQALKEATGARIVAYVHLLHSWHPTKCEEARGAWPTTDLICETVPGILRNVDGELSVRWYVAWSDRLADQIFHSDPSQDPSPYVDGLLELVERWPVDGLFVDYLATAPWTYPDDPPLDLRDGGLMWKSYQVRFLWELRKKAPGLWIIANGSWAMQEQAFAPARADLIDAVFWERSGTIWWEPPRVLQMLLDREGDGAAHFLDAEVRGGRAGAWNLEQMARTAAILRGYGTVDRIKE